MKSSLRLFFISLIATISLIMHNCDNTIKSEEKPKVSTMVKTVHFTVKGMTCHACTFAIKKALSMPGIESVEVSLAEKHNVRVSCNPSLVSIKEMIAAINGTGFQVIETKEI